MFKKKAKDNQKAIRKPGLFLINSYGVVEETAKVWEDIDARFYEKSILKMRVNAHKWVRFAGCFNLGWVEVIRIA